MKDKKNERKNGKKIGAYVFLTFALTIVFSMLMIICYLIPDSAVRSNVERSTEIIKNQGIHHIIVSDQSKFQVDNWTETYVLNMAIHTDDDPIRSAFRNPYYNLPRKSGLSGEEYRLQSLIVGLNEKANDSYGRYWQGYLVFIRPLLTLMNLSEIYVLLSIVLGILLIISCTLLAKEFGMIHATVFLLSMLMVDIWMVGLSTKFFSSFAIALIGLIAVCLGNYRINEYRTKKILFILGACTVFFDYMSTPLVALCIPMTVLLYRSRDTIEKMRIKASIIETMKVCASWILGWLCLGTMNWIIYIIASPSAAEALSTIILRLHNWTGSGNTQIMNTSTMSGLGSVLQTTFPFVSNKVSLLILCFFVVAPIIICLLKNKKKIVLTVSMMILPILNVLWWIVLSESVTVHAWCVYRAFAGVLYPLFVTWIYVIGKEKSNA